MNVKNKKYVNWMVDNAIIIALLLLLIVIIAVNPNFLSIRNFRNIISQASTRMILALGVGGIIVSKGTDLSVGRQVGLAAIIAASLMQRPDYATRMYPDLGVLPVIVPIIIVIIICALVSLTTGFVVAKLKVDPFIATLGMMLIVYGINCIYVDRPPLGAQPVGGLDSRFTGIATGSVFGIPYLIIFATLCVGLVWFIWNKTVFGKNLFATGGNIEAAKVSGVNTIKTLLITYTFAGMLYGFGGALEAARVGSATNNTGNMYELDAIAACIVGGLSFNGGIGSVGGIVVGVLIFQVIAYGLNFIGVNAYIQYIIKGLIILAAVAIDSRKYHKNI